MSRLIRIIAGYGLLIAGILMLFLPGPGIATVVAGLALLARDLAWAGRLEDWVKRKFTSGEDE